MKYIANSNVEVNVVSEQVIEYDDIQTEMRKIMFSEVRLGDRVTIVTPHGQERSGRATIFNREQNTWVLNGGGKYGTPIIVTPTNICKRRSGKR